MRWSTVEDGSGTERVEIELTSHSDRRGWRRGRRSDPLASPIGPAAPPFGAETSGDMPASEISGGDVPAGGDGPLSSERARLVVTGLAAGAIALFIGWSLGRAGDSGSAATDDDGSVAPSTTLPHAEIGSTIPDVDPSLLPTTTAFTPIFGTAVRPSPSQSPSPSPPPTTVPGWVSSIARVAPPAIGLGVQIVGIQPDGVVVELDTATGDLSSIDSKGRVNYQGSLYAGADWILVGAPDSSIATLFRGHGERETVTLGQPWMLHWEPGTDRFWRLDQPNRFGDPMQVTEILYDGTETGVSFTADARFWVPGADPAGGLVVLGAPGGSYHIAPDGKYRITTGDVIALNAQIALASDCGEAMEQCGLVVIDRATGESTPLQPTVLEPSTDPTPIEYFDSPAGYGWPSLLTAISPDGRYSPIMVAGADQDYGVVDLTTGEFIQFGDVPESGLWWSPDSRTAIYLVNGHLTAFDFDTRTTYEVSQDVFPLQEFAVRPAA